MYILVSMESLDRPIFDSRDDAHVPFEAHGSEALKDELQEAASAEHHNSNLFDQDEDRSGEKIDLATGKKIDNSTDHGLDNLSVHHDVPVREQEDEDDAAARWLRENDPDLKK